MMFTRTTMEQMDRELESTENWDKTFKQIAEEIGIPKAHLEEFERTWDNWRKDK